MKNAVVFILIMCSLSIARTFPHGYMYLSPTPGAQFVSAFSPVIVRFEQLSLNHLRNVDSCIQVHDERGIVKGNVTIASDERTLIFQPDEPFPAGSTVQVNLTPQSEIAQPVIPPARYSFHIAKNESTESLNPLSTEPENTPPVLAKAAESGARIMPNGVSVPSDFPFIEVTTRKETADGYLFLNNWREQNSYNIIFDNDGSPLWYARREIGDRRWNFKVQKNGLITMLTRLGGLKYVSYDEDFEPVDEYTASGGYATDEHELIMLENGHYFLLGLRTVKVDMSQFLEGALTDVSVHETTLQEFTADHQLIFNWPAIEHLQDGLPFAHDYHAKSVAFSYPHMNAIDIDDDGHILLSSRNLDEITKINRQTGEIIWRLGGVHNQFTFVDDPLNGFNWQHDVRSLGDGYYSIFDNGREHHPSRTRAIVYKLDTETMTATLVWEYQNPPRTDISFYMGNVQKLPNDNFLINWAANYRPKATEVTPDGEVVYEMNFVEDYACYRTFRFPWNGMIKAPYLVVESGANYVTLIFNKFGDADVDYYKIYAGVDPNPTTLLDTCKTTLKYVYNLENKRKYFFRVTAVSRDGRESPFSEEKSGFLIKKAAHENLLNNSDFSNSKQSWLLKVSDAASATWETASQQAHINIERTDEQPTSIVLKQGKIFLDQDAEYTLEFDAWAIAPRTLRVQVCDVKYPDSDLANIGAISLGRSQRHYEYQFNITSNVVLDAELKFLLGADENDVYLDNIQFTRKDATNSQKSHPADVAAMGYNLWRNFPNPFNPHTQIRYDIGKPGFVELKIVNVLGQDIRTLVNEEKAAGSFDIFWDGKNDAGLQVPAGLYFYRLKSANFSETRKMLLVK